MHDWQAFVKKRLALPRLNEMRQQRIVRELAEQLEDFYRDALAGGMSEAEAQAHARRQVQDWPGLASSIDRAEQPNRQSRLLLCVLLACYIPARRAARVDPLVALRYE